MQPDDPRHGTYAGATAHRVSGVPACEPCAEAKRTYDRRSAKERRMGRSKKVEARLVGGHVRRLIDSGLPVSEIAKQSGVTPLTVANARDGRGMLWESKARKLLTVPLGSLGTVQRPHLGASRRLRALMAIGHRPSHLAAALGISRTHINNLTMNYYGNHNVSADLWDRIDALYRAECMNAGPSDQMRRRAVERGWAPPLAYEDIDDPDESPTDWTHVAADRATAIREFVAQGENATHIARRLDLTPRALERWCQRHLPDVWRTLAQREGDWNSTGNLGHQSRRGAA